MIFKQEDFNMITIDLKMDAAFIKENMQIKWVAENGLVENITRLVKEYKASRNLVVMIINSLFNYIL